MNFNILMSYVLGRHLNMAIAKPQDKHKSHAADDVLGQLLFHLDEDKLILDDFSRETPSTVLYHKSIFIGIFSFKFNLYKFSSYKNMWAGLVQNQAKRLKM